MIAMNVRKALEPSDISSAWELRVQFLVKELGVDRRTIDKMLPLDPFDQGNIFILERQGCIIGAIRSIPLPQFDLPDVYRSMMTKCSVTASELQQSSITDNLVIRADYRRSRCAYALMRHVYSESRIIGVRRSFALSLPKDEQMYLRLGYSLHCANKIPHPYGVMLRLFRIDEKDQTLFRRGYKNSSYNENL